MSSYEELVKANETLDTINVTVGDTSNETSVVQHHTSAFVPMLDGDEYVWVVDDGTTQKEIQKVTFNLSFTKSGGDNVRSVGDVMLVDIRVSPTFYFDDGFETISSSILSKKSVVTHNNKTIIIEPSGEGKVEVSVKCKTNQSSLMVGMTCDLEVIE